MRKIILLSIILLFMFITILYIRVFNTFYHKYGNNKIIIYNKNKITINYIPKVLHLTYHSKNKIPEKVHNNHSLYASDYKIIIYDDEDGEKIIKTFFPHDIFVRYSELSGAHKADLLRYCILYIYGGVYADIKTVFIQNLSDIIPPGDQVVLVNSNFSDGTMYNGFIATPPGKQIFINLITYILNIEIWIPKIYYLVFVHDCYNQVKADMEDKDIKSGFNKGYTTNYYIFDEICNRDSGNCNDGLDRYGLCCYIYDGELPIIKTRYSDYPW